MIIQLTAAVVIGILISRLLEWTFIAALKTLVANWLYYRSIINAFLIQLSMYNKKAVRGLILFLGSCIGSVALVCFIIYKIWN